MVQRRGRYASLFGKHPHGYFSVLAPRHHDCAQVHLLRSYRKRESASTRICGKISAVGDGQDIPANACRIEIWDPEEVPPGEWREGARNVRFSLVLRFPICGECDIHMGLDGCIAWIDERGRVGWRAPQIPLGDDKSMPAGFVSEHLRCVINEKLPDDPQILRMLNAPFKKAKAGKRYPRSSRG